MIFRPGAPPEQAYGPQQAQARARGQVVQGYSAGPWELR